MENPNSKPKKLTTLNDIAKKANVSLTTVSYILNGKGSINKLTRERVLRIAHDLNYVPNRAAQALRGSKTNSIGIIINRFNDHFFAKMIRGIERITDEKNYTYLLSQTHYDIEKEKSQLQLFANSGIDGLILCPCSDKSDHIQKFENDYKIPVVLFGSYLEDKNFLSVVADNVSGARMAVKQLLASDMRPIIHISGPMDQTLCKDRCNSYIQTMQEMYPNFVKEKSIYNVPEMTTEEGFKIMPKILTTFSLPLAIFAVNDEVALGVYRYCNENDIKIPEELSLVGFNDIEILSNLNIPITTIRIPIEELGKRATELLMDSIETKTYHIRERIILPVNLIERRSTQLN